MTFEEFCKTVNESIAKKEIVLPENVKLNVLDLAIQYAVGKEQEAQGRKDITLTLTEIYNLIEKYCGKDVIQRIEKEVIYGE